MVNNQTMPKIPAGRIPVLPHSDVIGLFGKRGSGKSAAAAVMTLNLMGSRQGINTPVFYYPPSFGFVYGQPLPPDELVQIPEKLNGAIVILDEMQVLLSKYRAMSTSSNLIRAFLTQVRKRGCTVIYTSNSPETIDHQVSQQTDFHGQCYFFEDRRCFKRGWHMPGCEDTVKIIFKDTQGRYGTVPNEFRRDPRQTSMIVLHHVARFYHVYNTGAIADPTDLMGLSTERVLRDKGDAAQGISAAEIEAQLQENWIPALVREEGATVVTAAALARRISRDTALNVSAVALGRALTALGVPRIKKKDANYYHLPEADALAEFIAGTWTPPE